MGQYSIYDVTPGETAELTFTVKGLDIGETLSNATLEIRSRGGSVMVPVKTITTVQNSNGLIEVVGGIPTLIFELTESETIALNPREPYYLFSVNVTTSLGRRQAIVPIGRLNPSSGYPFIPAVKLGSASISINLVGVKVVGSKT
jgi:hypothetical protein